MLKGDKNLKGGKMMMIRKTWKIGDDNNVNNNVKTRQK